VPQLIDTGTSHADLPPHLVPSVAALADVGVIAASG
jgi:hypothetical protein